MDGKHLGTVILTVALLALGAVAGASLKGTARDTGTAEKLERLEEAVDALRAQQEVSTKSLEPASQFLRQLQELSGGSLLSARLNANETAAIATLRNIVSAQAQFQQSGKADTDNDGTGEYGGFIELSGAARGRMLSRLIPPVLSGTFRVLNASGEVSRSGYFFRIFLPDEQGGGEGEPPRGFADDDSLDGDLSETTWCCYAWPVVHGKTGNRTFLTNQGGDVVAVDDANYSGTGNGPAADAAFQSEGSIVGSVAVGERGSDHNPWQQVN